MNGQQNYLYEFGSFRLDPVEHLLLCDGKEISLTPKVFDTLAILVENHGHIVDKDKLMELIWADAFVDESNLAKNVSVLRKVLAENDGNLQYIETIPKRGYRFVAPIIEVKAEESSKKTPQTDLVPKNSKTKIAIIASALIISVFAIGFYFYSKTINATPLTDKDVILLTDFDNKTGEEIFDDTLKQGLTMALQQSPFLSIFPEAEAHETLKLMKRDPKEKITKELGREISQRKGLKAFVTGTLTKLGSAYVLGLEAVNTQTGETIAFVQAQADADDQKKVLSALSKAATEMRRKLGESVAQIEKFDKPLAEVTTSSLEALKALQAGGKLRNIGKHNEAIALFKRSIEIDPEFARGYLELYIEQRQIGHNELAMQSLAKAYKLRDKVSEREKIILDEIYYADLLGDSLKAIEVLETGKQMYPRDSDMRNDLGIEYERIGEHEKALVEAEEALKLDPNDYVHIRNLAYRYVKRGRFAEAKDIIERAFQKDYDSLGIYHRTLYLMSLVNNDIEAMQKEIDWFKGKPNEYQALGMQASTAAYRGQWKKSREFIRRAIILAGQYDNKGYQLSIFKQQALKAAILGQCSQVRSLLNESPANIAEFVDFALVIPFALVLCGENSRAQSLANEIKEKYPKSTLIHNLWLPIIQAITELKKGNAEEAIRILETARRYERASYFWVQTVRGEAYLKLNESEKAKVEFQKILDHRGREPASSLYPLAQLGKARAMKSKKEYEKFFEMWKDADEDLPVLIEAKKEYENLR